MYRLLSVHSELVVHVSRWYKYTLFISVFLFLYQQWKVADLMASHLPLLSPPQMLCQASGIASDTPLVTQEVCPSDSHGFPLCLTSALWSRGQRVWSRCGAVLTLDAGSAPPNSSVLWPAMPDGKPWRSAPVKASFPCWPSEASGWCNNSRQEVSPFIPASSSHL